jgi:hypothetical protein
MTREAVMDKRQEGTERRRHETADHQVVPAAVLLHRQLDAVRLLYDCRRVRLPGGHARPEAGSVAPTPAEEIARAGPKEHDEREPNTTAARPQLVVVSESTGSVPKALTEILKPVPGKRVEIADAYKGYATRCREMGTKPASTVQFAEIVKKTGIKTRMVNDLVYLLNVQLVSAMSQLSENTG